MLVFLGDGMPQKSSSNLERTTSQSGEAAMIAGRVGKSSAENENIRPGSYLNPLNRPVRTRMPGGVAGDAEDQPPRPYADFRPSVNVAYWHIADNPIAPAFVRFWTKADKGGFWPAAVCPLLTHSRHLGRLLIQINMSAGK